MPKEVGKMNIWVEYWKNPNKQNSSHAQMSENMSIYKPDPKEIQRRFFDKHEDAAAFAKRKNDEGYYAKVERDGAIYGR